MRESGTIDPVDVPSASEIAVEVAVARVQGVVRDLVTGETLGGVSVYVCGVSVFTGAAGRFGADVPPGECLVRAASAELVAADVVLTVVAGGIADVTV